MRPQVLQAGYLMTIGGSFIGMLSDGGVHQLACIAVAFMGIIVLIKENKRGKA